ncbi:TonB-dependent hemoglobin/transferrin/lactoferrin family receptor [Endozoicomonas sp.]|uniref:TonB-dependent hemoglobin/transferrin/lactoferrin family receptor n=1 Tax=Endozoicomonas sp. TaxID=1892382 RepID=UPI00383B94FC
MTFPKNTLALAMMAATVSLASTQAAFAEEVTEAVSQSKPTQMNQVTVTAIRTNQAVDAVAASVAVITNQELEADMAQNLGDVFEYTPGVTINDANRQGIQSINIRGMEGKRVKILVDGVSQPGVFDGGEYEFINSGAVSVDVDMLKSVEVVKGAASSLQGSDAIGGIVAFETKDPEDFLKDGRDFGGQVKLSYSSRDKSFSEHGAVAGRFGNVEALVAYTRRDGKELQNFADEPQDNYSVDAQDYKNNDLLVKLQSQLNDDHRLEFTGEVIHNQSDSDIVHSTYKNVKGEDTNKQTTLALKHMWYANSGFADTVTSRISWLSKEENGVTNRFQPASAGFPPFFPPSNDNQQKKDYIYSEDKIEFETQLDKTIDNHFLVYGLSVSSSDISNINKEYNSDPDKDDVIIGYTPEAKELGYGLYLQDEIILPGDRLVLTPGIRYDYSSTDPSTLDGESFEKFSDSALTARLGATYKLSEPGTVFAQISQGFRAPSFDELYYTYDNPDHGYENVPNPDLKSEKSLSYELGYRHNNAFSASEVAVFYSDYSDFIERVSIGDNGGLDQNTYVNINEATIKGVELSSRFDWHAIAQLPEGLTTRFVVAYTEGEDGNSRPLNSVNPWNAVVAFNYDAPASNWGTSLKVNYTARKSDSDINADADNGGIKDQVELPSATVVDLTAYYKPMKDLTIRAGIMNLTDEKYYSWNDVRGTKALSLDDTQAERNYTLSVKYDF